MNLDKTDLSITKIEVGLVNDNYSTEWAETIDEIEDPELAQERMKEIYEQKGYSKSWIDKRLRGIAVRQDLMDEWQKRGINEHIEFAILTAEISKASFGLTPSEYKKLKRLKNENLRDLAM